MKPLFEALIFIVGICVLAYMPLILLLAPLYFIPRSIYKEYRKEALCTK
jgi:hypothetical protein